jgi:hypothetical protein
MAPPPVVSGHRPRPALRPTAPGGTGGQMSTSASDTPMWGRGRAGRRWRDAQASVPSTGRTQARLAFKDSMVRGILQFTPRIAFRYVLHRCEGRDIRCRESSDIEQKLRSDRDGVQPARPRVTCSLAPTAPGVWSVVHTARAGTASVRGCPSPTTFVDTFTVLLVEGFDNDPSAGSPTETLLRLLLPLNDKVQWTSQDVASGEPPPSPRSEHFTGPFNR